MIKCNALTNGVTVLPTGKIMPCCAFDETYSEVDRGPDRFKEIKQDLDNNIKHPACKDCWRCEENNIASLRNGFYNTFELPTHNNDIVFLDIRNTNICNLHCRMCSPMYSSTIGKNSGASNFIKTAPVERYLTKLDKVRDLYFTGGEPMLNPDHWKILESIPYPETVHLRYNSNLTLLSYKDKHIFEYWKKFKSIFFQVSLEGYQETNELIRIGSSWDNIEKNINSIIEFKKNFENFEFGAFICVNVLTLWDLDKLVDYLISKDIGINLSCIPTPDWISLNVLPFSKRDSAKKQLEIVYNKLRPTDTNPKQRIELAIEQLDTVDSTSRFSTTVQEIQRLDRMHNINLFDKIKHNLL